MTPASVACADSTTATNSVKGLRCSSSPLGSGLACRKRLKASRTSASVQGLFVGDLAPLGAAALDAFFSARPDLEAGLDSSAGIAGVRFAEGFDEERAMLFLARWRRMILAISGV